MDARRRWQHHGKIQAAVQTPIHGRGHLYRRRVDTRRPVPYLRIGFPPIGAFRNDRDSLTSLCRRA